jgi:FAD/FMN-containing dehydrogenase
MNNFIFNESKRNAEGTFALGIAGDKKAYVLFEVSGPAKNEDLKERLLNFLNDNKQLIDFNNSLPAFDFTARKLLWHIREHCTDASRRIAGANAVRFDTCVPVDKIAASLNTIEKQLLEEYGSALILVAFGHWGDGNIHLHVIQDKDKGELSAADREKIEAMILRHQVGELGGSASAEHGFGRLLNKFQYYSSEQRKTIIALKNTLDPDNILNPGIAVPTK